MNPRWLFDRRRFLKTMGLGGMLAGYGLTGAGRSLASGNPEPPKRVVFLVSSHGHVWDGWRMHLPDAGATEPAQAAMGYMAETEFSRILQPFYGVRDKITAIDGLAHTSVLGEFVSARDNVDLNNHTLSYAHLLTNQYAMQLEGGARCRANAASIDQVLGQRTKGPGRYASLTWDSEPDVRQRYGREYSYRAPGQATPFESDPQRAFADLMGIASPTTEVVDRDALLRAAQVEALDAARDSFDVASRHLGGEGKRKLEQHRQLLAELQRDQRTTLPMSCRPEFVARGDMVQQFMRLATVALSCDLTRVVTLVMPVLEAEDLGFDSAVNVHSDLAHASIQGGSRPFSPAAEEGMIAYNRWYAERVADFIGQLDSVPEANGSLLDNTAVVWLSELATPTHEHVDVCTVLAGGSDVFRHGRYLRYPSTIRAPTKPATNRRPANIQVAYPGAIGPSTAHLLISLMRHMGFEDEYFGLSSVRRYDGTDIDLRGPLELLHNA